MDGLMSDQMALMGDMPDTDTSETEDPWADPPAQSHEPEQRDYVREELDTLRQQNLEMQRYLHAQSEQASQTNRILAEMMTRQTTPVPTQPQAPDPWGNTPPSQQPQHPGVSEEDAARIAAEQAANVVQHTLQRIDQEKRDLDTAWAVFNRDYTDLQPYTGVVASHFNSRPDLPVERRLAYATQMVRGLIQNGSLPNPQQMKATFRGTPSGGQNGAGYGRSAVSAQGNPNQIQHLTMKHHAAELKKWADERRAIQDARRDAGWAPPTKG